MDRREFLARIMSALVFMGTPLFFVLEYLRKHRGKEEPQETPSPTETPTETPSETPLETPEPTTTPMNLKEFLIDGKKWNLEDIVVNRGDKVIIKIDGGKGHYFHIDWYAGTYLFEGTNEIKFVAKKAGKFMMYPSTCHCSSTGDEWTLTVLE